MTVKWTVNDSMLDPDSQANVLDKLARQVAELTQRLEQKDEEVNSDTYFIYSFLLPFVTGRKARSTVADCFINFKSCGGLRSTTRKEESDLYGADLELFFDIFNFVLFVFLSCCVSSNVIGRLYVVMILSTF